MLYKLSLLTYKISDIIYKISDMLYMSLTIPKVVPQRPFCYLNFIRLNPKSLVMKRMMRMSWQAARHTESKKSLKSGFRTAKIHVILTIQS